MEQAEPNAPGPNASLPPGPNLSGASNTNFNDDTFDYERVTDAISNTPLALTPKQTEALKALPGQAPSALPAGTKAMVDEALTNVYYPGYLALNPGATKADCLAWLIALLEVTGAVISGGFILRALGRFNDTIQEARHSSTTDIDIYVPCKHLYTLYSQLVPVFQAETVNVYGSSFYCRSFLRRNGIRSVHKFEKEATDYTSYPYKTKVPLGVGEMDIMAVRNARAVTDVVQNFDLTFCQVWYDGTAVMATHPQHLDARVGYLQGDYVQTYLNGNFFLRNRMRKYMERGFDVRFDPAVLASFTDLSLYQGDQALCKVIKPVRDDAFRSRWANRAFFNFIVTKKFPKTIEYIDNKKSPLNGSSPLVSTPDDVVTTIDDKKIKKVRPTDGYDTEDYDLEDKTTYYPLVDAYAKEHDSELDKPELNSEARFHHLATRCIQAMWTPKVKKNALFSEEYMREHRDGGTDDDPEVSEDTLRAWITKDGPYKPYVQSLTGKLTRIGSDASSLEDDIPVYDFHSHGLEYGIGTGTIDSLLDAHKDVKNKDEMPCFLAPDCQRYLTRDELRPFGTPASFLTYITTGIDVGVPIDDSTTDFGILLRNSASGKDFGGPLFHETMCPFCLRKIDRGSGCEYVLHDRVGAVDVRKSPYCNDQERIDELFKQYKEYQKTLPEEYPGQGIQPLEVCIQCGSPCNGHTHFDPLNPGQLKQVPASMLTKPGLSPYAVCPVGGRPVLIARMLAVRRVLLAHKADDPKDWKAIRKEAALAGDAAPRDPVLMERAKRLYAIEVSKRKFNNTGLNAESGGEGYTGTGAVVASVDEEEKVAEEEEAPVVEAPVEAPAGNQPAQAGQNALLEALGLLPAQQPVAEAPNTEQPNPRGLFGNNNANFLGGQRRAKTLRRRLSAKRRGILKKRYTAKKLKQ